MQDFTAAPADSGPVASELRAMRLTGGKRPDAASETVRPGLLDTRFVLAELSRLRAGSGASAVRPSAEATARRP